MEDVYAILLFLHKNLKNLFIKLEKSVFHRFAFAFLGNIINQGWIRKDPQNIKAEVRCPILRNVTEMQKWLGFTTYYNLIPGFSSIVTSLQHWFTAPPVLAHPDHYLLFIVKVDSFPARDAQDEKRCWKYNQLLQHLFLKPWTSMSTKGTPAPLDASLDFIMGFYKYHLLWIDSQLEQSNMIQN